MSQAIKEFIAEVSDVHATGIATEHSYRPALQGLFNALDQNVVATNEPKRVAVGAPDFIFSRNAIPIGHCEAKDIPVGLSNMTGANASQRSRYIAGFPNLIYTNCLDWQFIRDGEITAELSIGEYVLGIQSRPENFDELHDLLSDFVSQTPLSITSSKQLSERMASKAILIKDVLARTLKKDTDKTTEIVGQYLAFREHLIHDISVDDFADIYAETIAYGMFAARLHDLTPGDFSRQEAVELLPKSNPFLRNLFGFIAGPNLDDRISWIIDDLAELFRAADVLGIMQKFGSTTQRNDPFLHFYETFLSNYNPAKRKARGVWYTPAPVVDFIVRAVDQVLMSDFNLELGLADTSKVSIDWSTGQKNKKGKMLVTKKNVHRVQILDPAVGTGTFLTQAIKHIAPKIRQSAPGIWTTYIEKDLIPRVHGFELLMASYAMCHLKLDMVLSELGFQPTSSPPRLSVFLTNSLEDGAEANQTLPFAQWLSNEVKQANAIKRDIPIMCVIGNPPYKGESENTSAWIMSLMDDYKKEPGGYEKLKEKNSKWINDDYVKFLRLSEHLIDKRGHGVVGMITNHGYLDNPTFRGMRWHLLKTFDDIYVLDLHGNSKKKEVCPDGSLDKNVFDIQQGVAILIAVKTSPTTVGDKRKKGSDIALAKVHHHELWGDRHKKYEELWESSLDSIKWTEIRNTSPHFTFVPRDYSLEKKYLEGIAVRELFPIGGTGVVTKRDKLTIHFDRDDAWQAVQDMLNRPESEVREKYSIKPDVRDWRYQWARDDVSDSPSPNKVQPISYRPFDDRHIYYTGRSRGFVGWPVPRIMEHFVRGYNIGLCTARSNKNPLPDHFFITKFMMETKYSESSTQSAVFPLYTYAAADSFGAERAVNFDEKLFKKIRVAARDKEEGEPDELDIFDYIYGCLFCLEYRERFADFLKRDFPRVPWPKTPKDFWRVSAYGSKLRLLHLLDPQAVDGASYPFEGEGSAKIEKVFYKESAVFVNKTQRFIGVPEFVWEFSVGGYQPAQKWLKDRKGHALSFVDIQHYQKMVKALAETAQIMKRVKLSHLIDDESP